MIGRNVRIRDAAGAEHQEATSEADVVVVAVGVPADQALSMSGATVFMFVDPRTPDESSACKSVAVRR